jgi:hypothetical protein
MPTFPSREWMQSFCAELAAHPEADRVASALDGSYRFVIDPAGPLATQHTFDVRISGDLAFDLLDSPVDAPTLTLVADHERWRQLIEGKLDIGMALMMRRLKVRGDLSRLVGRLDTARPLVEALGQVPTVWLDQ